MSKLYVVHSPKSLSSSSPLTVMPPAPVTDYLRAALQKAKENRFPDLMPMADKAPARRAHGTPPAKKPRVTPSTSAATASKLQFGAGPFHVSLARTFPVRYTDIEGLLLNLREALNGTPRYVRFPFPFPCSRLHESSLIPPPSHAPSRKRSASYMIIIRITTITSDNAGFRSDSAAGRRSRMTRRRDRSSRSQPAESCWTDPSPLHLAPQRLRRRTL